MRTRRSFLTASAGSLIGLGLTGPLLAACAATPQRANTPASDSPRKGGTLRLAVATQADSWDPHTAATDITSQLLRPVFDSLVATKGDGTFHPWLATSWRVTDDGLSYTFALRTDVTFSDGEPFDADAVKANFDRIVDPATKSNYPASLLGPYAGTDVVDTHTVRIRMREPYSSLLQALSTTFLGFHSPKALRDHGGDLAGGGKHTATTGAFTFQSVVPGQQAVFARRPGYAWGPATAAHTGEAYLDGIQVSFLTEDQTRVGALTSGQLDAADQIPSSQVSALRGRPGLTILSGETPGTPYSYYLNTSRAPFDDPDVRRAFLHAVDVEGIIKGVFRGEQLRASSILSRVTRGYAKELESAVRFDRAEAERLLDKAGYTGRDSAGFRTKDGRTLRVDFPFAADYTTHDRRLFDVAVQDSLKRVGFDVRLYATDNANYAEKVVKGDYDVKAVAWGSADPALLREIFHSTRLLRNGGGNQGMVRDTRLDEWLDDARATLDLDKQNELYRQVQQRVIDQAYALPAYAAKRNVGLRDKVRGLTFSSSGVLSLYDTWLAEP
ncbi:peptide/nickel transport system substrate-binding protein [Sinosporangium album]|uniref:Peptide/nickel transport system substrate-binding protein n=1 Tax=Sinosporangium album TaxID=504805 RepID=A0A1G7YG19_9ACTN|nr:ABC transporter substrate-binding protein [Sinosporangium album]SDG94840.1 peptide/nickel transport system substrate-binding protein [Sinosporangium album]